MAMFARDANAGIALFPFNYGTICLSVKINPVMRGRVRHRTTHPEVCAKRERLCMKTVCVKGFFLFRCATRDIHLLGQNLTGDLVATVCSLFGVKLSTGVATDIDAMRGSG